jgi:uncharacterized membrane protein YkoI
MSRMQLFAGLIGLAMAALTIPAHADGDDNRGHRHDDEVRDKAYEGRKSGALRPLAEIVAELTAQTAGTLLEVELDEDDNVPVYEIYILQSGGRVVEYKIDARTGRHIDVKDERDD